MLDEPCDELRRSRLILLLVLELSDAMRGVETAEKEGVEGARAGVAGARMGVADAGEREAAAGVAGWETQISDPLIVEKKLGRTRWRAARAADSSSRRSSRSLTQSIAR